MDERLRQFERRGAEGDPQAEARLIKELLRAGELSNDRVELAAYLGDPSARQILAESAPEQAGEFTQWLDGLISRGQDVAVRAVAAATEDVLPIWEGHYPQYADLPQRAVDTARAWTENPGKENEKALRKMAAELQTWNTMTNAPGFFGFHIDEDAARQVGEAAYSTVRAVTESDWNERIMDAITAVQGAIRLSNEGSEIDDQLHRIRTAIENELTTWALTPRIEPGQSSK